MAEYIYISREDLDMFGSKVTGPGSLYIELLLMGDYEPFVTTTRRLADRFRVTTDNIRKWLKKLDGELISVTRGKGRNIIIRLYNGEEIEAHGAERSRIY